MGLYTEHIAKFAVLQHNKFYVQKNLHLWLWYHGRRRVRYRSEGQRAREMWRADRIRGLLEGRMNTRAHRIDRALVRYIRTSINTLLLSLCQHLNSTIRQIPNPADQPQLICVATGHIPKPNPLHTAFKNKMNLDHNLFYKTKRKRILIFFSIIRLNGRNDD